MIAAIVVGFSLGNAFGSVANPIIIQSIYGRKNYSAILGLVTACNNLAGVFTPVMIGSVYDYFGSYSPAFAAMMLISSCCTVGYFILLGRRVEYD